MFKHVNGIIYEADFNATKFDVEGIANCGAD